jgi:hypothetical protein
VESARPQSGPGLPLVQILGRYPPQVARVMPPSPPPLSSRRRSPPSSSTQSGAGERDPPPARPAARLPGCPAARRGLPAPGSRLPACSHPPAPLQLAGVHGRPYSEGGGTSPGGAEGSGPRRWRAARRPAARAARVKRPGAKGAIRLLRVSPPTLPPLCPVPAIRNNVELPGRRGEPRSLLSLSFSHSPSSSLSPALP